MDKNYIGEVVYSAKSDGEGGAIIIYHIIKRTAISTIKTNELVEGVIKQVLKEIKLLNTDKMEKNEYITSEEFFTLEELPHKILEYINKKKLY